MRNNHIDKAHAASVLTVHLSSGCGLSSWDVHKLVSRCDLQGLQCAGAALGCITERGCGS